MFPNILKFGTIKISLSVLIVAPLALAIMLTVASVNRALDLSLLREAEASARSLVILTKSAFESTSDLIDGKLQEFAKGYDPTLSEFAQWQRLSRLKLPSSIVQVAIADEDGVVTTSNISYPVTPTSIADRPHFRVFADGGEDTLFISVPVLGRVSQQYTLQFVRRLSYSDGRFAGIVVASYSLDDINAFFKTVAPDQKVVITIFGTDGIVRIDTRGDELLGTNISESQLFQDAMRLKEGDFRATLGANNDEFLGFFKQSEKLKINFSALYDIDATLNKRQNFSFALWIAAIFIIALMLSTVILVSAEAKRREIERIQEFIIRSDKQKSEILNSLRSIPSMILAFADSAGRVIDNNSILGPTTINSSAIFTHSESNGDIRKIYSDRINNLSLCTFINRPEVDKVLIDRFEMGGKDWEIFWTVTPLSEAFTLDSNYNAISKANGQNLTFLILGFDNSGARRKDLAMQQLSKLATLGEVATGLSHEMNQPLNVIRLAAENATAALQESGDIGHALEKLKKIVFQTERAGRVIDHMRSFARRDVRPIVQHDPWEAINGALNIIGEQLRLAGIDLIVNARPSVYMVRCNQENLEQVLLNLLSNARDAIIEKAAVEGSGWPRIIDIYLGSARDGTVQLSVTDTGGGIPADMAANIFEPFFTTKPAGKGTGLGLPLSRSIIRDNGGEITTINVGDGARFIVNLPLLAGNKTPEAAIDDALTPRAPKSAD